MHTDTFSHHLLTALGLSDSVLSGQTKLARSAGSSGAASLRLSPGDTHLQRFLV